MMIQDVEVPHKNLPQGIIATLITVGLTSFSIIFVYYSLPLLPDVDRATALVPFNSGKLNYYNNYLASHIICPFDAVALRPSYALFSDIIFFYPVMMGDMLLFTQVTF